jgi:15-cis-phytoene synthase
VSLIPRPASPIPSPVSDLDQLVRRADEDRWLASRFAPAFVRERLIAIYAVNYEIARIAETVTEPGLGDIRLQWWREAIEDIHAGRTCGSHPALQAYAIAHLQAPLPLSAVSALVAARRHDFEQAPFDTVVQFDDYLNDTSGSVMRLAIAACGGDPASEDNDRLILWAGWIWGCVGLLRAEPFWISRGRSFIPREGGSVEKLRERAQGALAELRTLRAPDSSLFPAVGYVRLAAGYLRALERGRTGRPLFERQLTLIAASATGKL